MKGFDVIYRIFMHEFNILITPESSLHPSDLFILSRCQSFLIASSDRMEFLVLFMLGTLLQYIMIYILGVTDLCCLK